MSLSTLELKLNEHREPTRVDAAWLSDVLDGTNNGYLFAPSGWHVRIGRAFPEQFAVIPQFGPWPWRVERAKGRFTLRVWEGATGPWWITGSLGTPDAVVVHPLYRRSYESRAEAQAAVKELLAVG